MKFHDLYILYRNSKEYGHKEIRKYGLTDTEYMICIFLLGHHKASQDDVCNTLKLEKPTISRALLSLESKNYVARCTNPDNRRKNELTLTESGRNRMEKISGIYDTWLSKISEELSDEERQVFDKCCEKLIAASDKIKQ